MEENLQNGIVDEVCESPGCVRLDGHKGKHRNRPDIAAGAGLVIGKDDSPEAEAPLCGSENDDGLVCGQDAGHEHPHRNVTGKGVKYWQNEAETSSFFNDDPEAEAEAPLPGSAGKRRMELVDLPFIAEMALQMEAGIKDGRVAHDWRDLPVDAAIQERTGAIMRHLLAAQTRGATDPDSGASHWAAIADCAMICRGLERQAAEEGEG